MTFTEIFEAIAEATGIEYSHFSVLGRIWDLADYYGVERRGKLVSQVLRELPQLVNRSPESNLISDLLNLTMRYSKYLSLTGAYSQETTTGAQKLDLSNVTDRFDTTHELTDTGLTVTGIYYVSVTNIEVQPNTDMYLSYEKSGSGVNQVSIYKAGSIKVPDKIYSGGGTGGTFNTGDNSQVDILFYSGYGSSSSSSSTYNDVMLCEGTSAKPYEPYTGGAPSPNPDYAQEMQAVEISNLYSTGKNYFNKDEIDEEHNHYTTNGTPTDTGVTLTGNWYIAYKVNVPKNTDMYISYEKSGSGTNRCSIFNSSLFSDLTRFADFTNLSGGTFNTGNNDLIYILFYSGLGTSNTSTYSNIMLNIGSIAEPYTPYTGADTVTLSEPLILRALPNGVADSYEDGVITRRVGVMEFDGSADENWKIQQTSNPNVASFYIDVSNNKSLGYTSMLCDKLTPNVSGLNNTSNVNVCSFNSTNGSTLIMDVANEIVTIVDDWRTYLQSNPITVWYEPATPTTEALDIDLEWYGMENFWTDSELDPNMTWKGVSTGVD